MLYKGLIRYSLILLVMTMFTVQSYATQGITIYSTPDSELSIKKSESKSLVVNEVEDNQFYKTTKLDKFSSSKFFDIAGFGIPIVIAGLSAKHEDNRFSTYTKDYPRTFENHFDDYVQYVPLAAKYIMKASGVKGRTSWGRMVTSDLFAVALMAGSVELLKNTIDMQRPDESTCNSFPSGHTATAFMAATLLCKEYGHISPWISVASYALASSTAMGRQLNSRHWTSDLMVGAGIGVVSAELGYYFADLIFKEKGLYYKPTPPKWEVGRKPSRFTTIVGVSTVLGKYVATNGKDIDIKIGNRVAFEGVWFPHKNVGVGGRLGVSNNMFAVDKNILQGWLGNLSLYAGGYYETQMTSRWSVGTKTLFGYNFFSGWASWIEEGIPQNDGSFGFLTGVSFGFLAKENLRFSLDCDYHLMTSSRVDPDKMQHEIFAGATTSVMF